MQNIESPQEFQTKFLRAVPTLLPGNYNAMAISSLFDAVDQISIGNRPALNSSFAAEELENGTENFEIELQQFGVNLTNLQSQKVNARKVVGL